ncbi:hypothetical protein BU16DRAFT_582570 [Lophium mytilinum]|uniref:Uncharacterized protein n=1 Tax=Lophium mytilinum TaxID=390894 RepID=A0A6A6QQQ9_9PEZI|nr:hypothetical protein BU16DRAFT_582570 [Lophium mytilinum]
MASLLTLPPELRQAIISNSLSIEYKKTKDQRFHISTPFHAVCKLLEEDIKKSIPSWLPEPATGCLAPIRKIGDMYCVEDINNHFVNIAKSSNRTWTGIQELNVQLVRDEGLEGFIEHGLSGQHGWPYAFYILSYMIHNGIRNVIRGPLVLPESVEVIKVDLTIPPKAWALLNILGQPHLDVPMQMFTTPRPGQESMSGQSLFWRTLFKKVHELVNHIRYAPKRARNLSVEIVGTAPESQLEVIAQEPDWSLIWKLPQTSQVRGPPMPVDFSKFVKNVRAKKAEMVLEEERKRILEADERAMRAKRQKQELAKNMGEKARRRKEETKKRRKEWAQNMAEIRKKKRE